MDQQIYWHTTVEMPDDSNLIPVPEKVDVAIIGGGYTGLSAGRTLAKQGVKVAVLEAETIGWGASSRNGGMTLTGLKPSMQTVINKFGMDLAKRLFQVSIDSINTVEQIIKEENINCGFARSGYLLVANKPKQFHALKDNVDFYAREFNYKVRLVHPKDLRSEIGSDLYHGGLVDEIGGGLNPAQYLTGLAAAAEKAGVFLCARARVTRLRREGGRFLIETERGKVDAESVFVATSGYTGSVVKKLQKKIIPIGSFIIATEKLPQDLTRDLNPNSRMIVDYKHYLNYFRLWDNRLIFGGRAAFFPENKYTIARSAEILRREMIEVYPQLKNVNVEFVWGGTLDFAFDMMAHVGQVDGIYYALGYAGHGVALSTHLGMTVAQAIVNGNIKELPFAQLNFPNAPLGLYDGRPWFLPFAGAWHKILDWVE